MVTNQCYATENKTLLCLWKGHFKFFHGTIFFALYFHVILDNNLI